MSTHDHTICGRALCRPEAADGLYHRAELLAQAFPCPFCGGTTLTVGWWCLDDADIEAIECEECYAGAPFTAWQRRQS